MKGQSAKFSGVCELVARVVSALLRSTEGGIEDVRMRGAGAFVRQTQIWGLAVSAAPTACFLFWFGLLRELIVPCHGQGRRPAVLCGKEGGPHRWGPPTRWELGAQTETSVASADP